jgi:hypothetical protein
MAFRSDFRPPTIVYERDLKARAVNAIEAVVTAGAALLIAEPWRASRIIRGADRLTFDELAAEVSRRRALPPAADFNRALALAQLVRAIDEPAFAAAWPVPSALAESVRVQL